VDLYSLFHSSQVGSGNVARLQDPAVDLLLEGVRGAHSSEEARDRGRELHRVLLALAPFAFLTTDMRLGLVKSEVAGIGDSAPRGGARNLWHRQ
jgi:ABC-type oligopeptide transport system substrate-binding subunit